VTEPRRSEAEAQELVWYAAYGSNLSRARFECYLRGGTPDGATHRFPGCRDPSDPRDDRPYELGAELVFGGTSQTWGGGVAFVVPSDSATAKARLYLVTLEQFADVVAQENWLECGVIALEPPYAAEIADCLYGVVVPVGSLEGNPILTVTQVTHTQASPPTIAYLRHIAVGLREAHAMSSGEIVDYLASKRGIDGALDLRGIVLSI
jgi:cation transport regulator ChaC